MKASGKEEQDTPLSKEGRKAEHRADRDQNFRKKALERRMGSGQRHGRKARKVWGLEAKGRRGFQKGVVKSQFHMESQWALQSGFGSTPRLNRCVTLGKADGP